MSKEQKITTDIKVPNKDLETLKIHFPHCFDKDGNFQLEKFKNNLTEKEISFSTESYGLDWLGKSYARLLASDPATTLLKADESHNAKPENANSENLLIKGDNLEVLKHLANAYYEQVKMIYIDPPYNTGSDGFVYEDDRKFTVKELQNLIGIDAEKAKRILDFTKQKSNSHSAWLTFLYPRLYIAKQLLKDDGVIFVSIDDNEVAQLRLLMDEVFGEENFIAQIVVQSNKRGQTYKQLAKTHEYLLVFIKSEKAVLNELVKELSGGIKTDDIGDFTERELRNRNPKYGRFNRPNLYYPIYVNPHQIDNNGYSPLSLEKSSAFSVEVLPLNSEKQESCWRWGTKKLTSNLGETTLLSNIVARVKTTGEYGVYEKYRKDTFKAKTIWFDEVEMLEEDEEEDGIWDETGVITEQGSTELRKFGMGDAFDFPKPTFLLKKILNIGSNLDSICLDFFAGSGTTGQATMQLNADDGGNRKFILVQIPEPIDHKKNKAAYDFVKNELKAEPTIFEITKERLLRASKKINEGLDEKIKKLKTELSTEETKTEIAKLERCKTQNAFKIFETIPIWEDYNFEAEQFDPSQTLFDAGKLTEDDIKAMLTTWKTYDGIALTQELESVDLSGYTAYYGNGRLYLMNKGFTTDSLKALLEKIDTDKHFEPKSIIAFGYHLESKSLREISENVKTYNNKKKSDIDFITRY